MQNPVRNKLMNQLFDLERKLSKLTDSDSRELYRIVAKEISDPDSYTTFVPEKMRLKSLTFRLKSHYFSVFSSSSLTIQDNQARFPCNNEVEEIPK